MGLPIGRRHADVTAVTNREKCYHWYIGLLQYQPARGMLMLLPLLCHVDVRSTRQAVDLQKCWRPIDVGR